MRLFATGAVRDDNASKGACHLLPPRAILLVSKRLQEGARKYGERNWERGIPISSFVDSGLRHLLMFMSGKQNEDHLVAVATNMLMAIETRERCKEGILPSELGEFGLPSKPVLCSDKSVSNDQELLVYLASPYSLDENGKPASAELRQLRYNAALNEVLYVYENFGLVVFSPIVYTVPFDSTEDKKLFEFWRKFDFLFLSRCNALAVLQLSGYDVSIGVKEEIRFAKEHGIPIHFVKPHDPDSWKAVINQKTP